jgi:hypothetical protein
LLGQVKTGDEIQVDHVDGRHALGRLGPGSPRPGPQSRGSRAPRDGIAWPGPPASQDRRRWWAPGRRTAALEARPQRGRSGRADRKVVPGPRPMGQDQGGSTAWT